MCCDGELSENVKKKVEKLDNFHFICVSFILKIPILFYNVALFAEF